MATTLLFRRGDTATSNAFTGTEGELFVDTQKDTVVVHDGTTAGGHPLATETYVNAQINTLIDSAPGTLDTLNELAAALGDDANFATTVTNSLATKLATADFGTTADSYLTAGAGLTYLNGQYALDPTASVDLSFVNTYGVNYEDFSTGDVAVKVYGEGKTSSSTTPFAAAEYLTTVSRSAKVLIQGFDTVADEIHVSELLVTFDGVTASATEYATIFSGAAPLYTATVAYVSGINAVQVIITPASANAMTYKTFVITLGA
jgi:hypothetical protein